MGGNQRDIRWPFAKRGQVYRQHVEAVEKILPEITGFDFFGQWLIGRSDNSDIDMNRPCIPQRFDFFFLQHPEQLGLDGGGDVTDFIKKMVPLWPPETVPFYLGWRG